MSILSEIVLNLNKFKIILHFKGDKDPLSILFDKSPSRTFYFCLISLVLIEMKKKGDIGYVKITSDKISDDLALIDKHFLGSKASKENQNRFAKIKKAWLYNLSNLSKGLHFVVERRDIKIKNKQKYYECEEIECDMWASLFEFSPKNSWLFKFALNSPQVNLDLDNVSVVFNGKKDVDAWDDFLASIKKNRPSDGEVISLVDEIEKTTAKKKKHSYTKDLYDALPDLPQHEIVGRENDLKTITDKLEHLISKTEKRPKKKISAIHGLPGVGKTTMSIILPHDKKMQKIFSDGILWFCLGKEPEIIKQIKKYAVPFASKELSMVSSIDQAESILRRFVNKGRYLIIVDDVWEISHLKLFLKISSTTPTLITTRIREIPYSLNIVPENIFKLDILSDNESLKLLGEFVPDIASNYRKECLELVGALEGLPLAIRVAGHLLRKEKEYGLSVPSLIEQLKNGKKILDSEPPAEMQLLSTESTKTVAALLKRSIESLTPIARQCFAVLAYLPPKPEVLTMDDLKGCWQVNNPEDVLRELLDLGLIENSQEKESYQVHYLMMLLASTIQE